MTTDNARGWMPRHWPPPTSAHGKHMTSGIPPILADDVTFTGLLGQ
jgi:hypothetical protein